ncbi:hypothetical protein [Dongia rigui]|uniref:Uncharacterized protein n=1 Tax=Dongia rigui TaxID=940149 RepID=A0ABU5DZS8_9PROT|nr:hypothetical protein [Dongia rigui]MDY0872816.1 hypothetical protein [Dongia rigui]
MPSDVCYVCKRAAPSAALSLTGDIEYHIQCAYCGTYRLRDSALSRLDGATNAERGRVAEWISSAQGSTVAPVLDVGTLDYALSRPRFRFSEQLEKMLVSLAKREPRLDWVALRGDRLGAFLQTIEDRDVDAVARHLEQHGWMKIDPSGGRGKLTSEGLLQGEKLLGSAPDSSQVFVAMWFSEEMEPAWLNGLKKGIELAGYVPFRVSQQEHVNKICDEIIAQIRRSKFIVADYTGHRGGVYYEAGFASGRGLQVIPTCRKDDIEKLHFDVRQYNCIDWTSPEELAQRLSVRISAVMGDGPLRNRRT